MDPHELIRPGQAQRLAAARRTAGREIGELAALLGISFEWYRDLESFDEEMVDTLSFDQLLKLCSSLGIEPRGFFDAHDLGHVQGIVEIELFADGRAEFLVRWHGVP